MGINQLNGLSARKHFSCRGNGIFLAVGDKSLECSVKKYTSNSSCRSPAERNNKRPERGKEKGEPIYWLSLGQTASSTTSSRVTPNDLLTPNFQQSIEKKRKLGSGINIKHNQKNPLAAFRLGFRDCRPSEVAWAS